jgi:hypothetical protein
MENNVAIKAKLGNIKKIEGADKIVSADILLDGVSISTVVVGADSVEGQDIIYFDSNLCLSDVFIEYRPELKTYLAKGNRVRCIKLKGVISNGLCVPIEAFWEFTKDDIPDSFTHLNGVEICKKWLPPQQESCSRASKMGRAKNAKKENIVIKELFNFHIDTQQLIRNLHKINPTDVISISRKVHGTSAIVSHGKIKNKQSLIDRILHRNETSWGYLFASRTVVKNADGKFHDDLWSNVGQQFVGKLHKGETVYYEIIGYFPGTSTYIQKGYDYGCAVGEYKIAVYRITMTNDDGVVTEYSWAAMRERCKELNTTPVTEFYFGRACDLVPLTDTWHIDFAAFLKKEYLEKTAWDNISKKVPDEGIVIRVEAKDITVFKYKSEAFFLQESQAADAGEVDTEAGA